ncbi:MAG: DUF4367 domain-containing protein [Eubacteriales bacterium]|jgi:hypothetical protein
MTNRDRNEAIFDALLLVAAQEAFQREMDALPSVEELNSMYHPSDIIDRKIRTIIKNGYRKNKIKKAVKKCGKVAASIAVVFTLFLAVLLSVEATRIAIFNAIIEWHEEYTEIRFEDSEKSSETPYAPSYLPEGYIEQSTNRFGNTFMIIYSDKDGTRIIFDQKPSGAGTIFVDSENAKYKELDLSGIKAFLFEPTDENERNILIWQYDGYTFQISSSVESEELIKIGESVKK